MRELESNEIVIIVSSLRQKTKHFIGRLGVIIGMTFSEDGKDEIIDYGVRFEGEKDWYRFLPHELEPTGKTEDTPPSVSIRVGVDEKGRGFLLDE